MNQLTPSDATDLGKQVQTMVHALPGGAKGLGAWLSVVRTYQKCADVISQRIKPLGIKLAQHEVLVSLLSHSPQTQQQLAASSYVTKSHMSAVLADMASSGWLTREGSAGDRRSKAVVLTEAGQALALRAFGVQMQVVSAMMGSLSAAQTNQLAQVSASAIAGLESLGD